jgi:hypothetical protein
MWRSAGQLAGHAARGVVGAGTALGVSMLTSDEVLARELPNQPDTITQAECEDVSRVIFSSTEDMPRAQRLILRAGTELALDPRVQQAVRIPSHRVPLLQLPSASLCERRLSL